MDPAAKRRVGERSTVERVYANLLENSGGAFGGVYQAKSRDILQEAQ